MMKKALILIFTLTLVLTWGTGQILAQGAKARFEQYGQAATRSFARNLVPDFGENPQGFGVELKIEKQIGGMWQQVGLEHTFFTGDRLRFKIKANGSAYLMITNNGKLIWPQGARSRNLVPDTDFQHSGEQEIVMGPFKVVPPAGREHNVLMISPVPFSQQFDSLNLQQGGQGGGTPAGQPQSGYVEMQDIQAIESQLRGLKAAARNLVYETENNVNYIVSDDSDSNKPFVYEFYLNHR